MMYVVHMRLMEKWCKACKYDVGEIDIDDIVVVVDDDDDDDDDDVNVNVNVDVDVEEDGAEDVGDVKDGGDVDDER